MYGSEHAAPATRICEWAVEDGHEVLWAGYLGEITGSSRASHVQIQSVDNPGPELEKLVAEFQPQLTHSFNLSFLSNYHAEAGLGPLILSVFGGFNPLIDSPRPLNPAIDSLLAVAPTVIVESPLLLEAANIRYPKVECELICLGVNPDRYKPAAPAKRAAWRKALRISDDACLFLSARGIGDGYRQEDILTAFARALPDLPASAAIAFIRLTRSWNRSEREEELQQQAEKLGLADRLHWIPEVRHEMMPGIYGLADFVINYPVADAFPSTLLEAVACEVPIVTAHLPAYTGSYIEQYSILADPGDNDDLSGCLVKAASEPEVARSARVKQARQHVIENYSESDAKAKLSALYERVAQSG